MPGRERPHRVGDQIQIELADILRRRLKDPLPDLLTVTAVEVTADLRRATVFVSALSEDDLAASLRTLVHARGFLRTELGRRLRLRTVPELLFRPDRSIAHGLRIQELLNRLDEPGGGEDEA